jgi:hypothetical protein
VEGRTVIDLVRQLQALLGQVGVGQRPRGADPRTDPPVRADLGGAVSRSQCHGSDLTTWDQRRRDGLLGSLAAFSLAGLD